MHNHVFATIACLLLAATAAAQRDTATIRIQEVVARSQEGQKAASEMRSRWEAPLAELEKRDAGLKSEREALERESLRLRGVWPFRHAMRAKEKAKRSRAIDRKMEEVARERAKIRAAVAEEQRRVVSDIARRLIPLLESYAKDHGYSLVLDTGQENGPVIVTLNDITDEMVRLFDGSTPPAQ